jgi:hypothetical protein
MTGPEEPRGDEPEFDNWIDDLDFEVLDCYEADYEEMLSEVRDVYDF